MKRLCLLALLVAFPAIGSCSQPTERFKTANLTWTGSLPCFAVEDSHETRRSPPRIAGLSVSRHSPEGSELVWRLDLTQIKPPLRLGPMDCLVYGESPPGARDPEPAPPLEVGGRYTMYFNAHVQRVPGDEESWVNRVYRQHFCIEAGASGEREMRVVQWSEGDRGWESCQAQAHR